MTRALDDLSAFLFHESRNAWLLLDPATDRVLDANPAAERLTGRARDDLRTTTGADLLRNSAVPLVGTRKPFPAGVPLQLLVLAAAPSAPPPTTGPSRSVTILMADDEPLIRALGRAVLERAGYRV